MVSIDARNLPPGGQTAMGILFTVPYAGPVYDHRQNHNNRIRYRSIHPSGNSGSLNEPVLSCRATLSEKTHHETAWGSANHRGPGEFFNGLTADALKDFESILQLKTYEGASEIFAESQSPKSAYLVVEGSVKISINSSDGRRLILRVASPGDVFGLSALVLNLPYDTTAETMHFCKIASIPKEEFLDFLVRHPESSQAAMRELSAEHVELCETLRILNLSSSVARKIARLLVNWSAAGDRVGDSARIKVFLTHEEIGEFVGASRESVSRTFAEFRQKRIIQLNGTTLTIPNMLALQHIAEA